MSIGDWSDDGHGKHDDFIISSNKPVEDVREAHFKIKAVTGIDIENICSEYEETLISDINVEELNKLGFRFHEDTYDDGTIDMYSSEMARLWVFLLEKADPELQLMFIDDDIPDLHFYGFDNKRRHIGQVGYGLFD